MKKSAKKIKAVKRSKSSAPETEMPDLIAVMLKLTERLEAVERKIDLVVSQTSNRQAFQQNQPREPRPQFVQHTTQPQHQSHSQQGQQQYSQPRHNQEQNFNRDSRPQQHSQNQNPQNLNRGQGAKPMYQAVCADCKKNCEVPFRPSGERPTYCKECYSKRKGGGNTGNQQNSPVSSGFPSMEKRQLKVVSNGVGKTTISEMVPSASRGASSNKKKPAKKSKK